MIKFFAGKVVPVIIFGLLAFVVLIVLPLGIRHEIQKREEFAVLYEELNIPINKDTWVKLTNDEQFRLISISINNLQQSEAATK